jgi:hypothetical protein
MVLPEIQPRAAVEIRFTELLPPEPPAFSVNAAISIPPATIVGKYPDTKSIPYPALALFPKASVVGNVPVARKVVADRLPE